MPPKAKPIEYYVDENGCHVCTSHPSGQLRVNGKTTPVHHYIYRMRVGEIEEGMRVIRTCRNNKCINPKHMTLATREEVSSQTAKKYNSPQPIEYEEDPVTGCHNCTSHPVNSRGYHNIKINGKIHAVHRVVYEQKYGKIPEGYVVRHKCDNTHCINPDHLELGTHADNMRDKVSRNRQAKGSKHGNAKLTEDDVREIKKRLAAGEMVIDLAADYGVHKSAIEHIKAGRTWRHVTID